MPLPANSSISLQGHSRPGEGGTTMPKIAMVVRMTEDTLDALQNLSAADRMDFEFGDKPGIFVRDQFFPMRYDKEKDNQELFIRTTMAARPNAPLKLNANVVGKFAIEKVLSDKITQRLHNATAAAAKQRAERKTIMLDSPPVVPVIPQKAAPKRKGPPKSTTKATTTIIKSYATTTPSATSSGSTSASTALPKELATTYRQRLVHYLALGAATVQDIFKEFDGQDNNHTIRSGIMDLLIEVAEQEQVPRKSASSSQVTKWQLKPQTWLDVRPYQFSGYTDNVRTKVARTARTWLSSLRIPENDSAWGHVKFRDSGHGGTGSAANSVQRSINGTTSAAAKAKTKTKEGKMKDTEMKVKSEVAPPARSMAVTTSLPPKSNPPLNRASTPLRNAKGKERDADTEKEEGELSASQTPPRVSVVHADRRATVSRSNGASTPRMQPPPVPVSSQSSQSLSSTQLPPSAPTKRTGPVDARQRRPPPEPSERARAAPPIPPPAPAERNIVAAAKKEVDQPKKVRASLPGDENLVLASRSSIQPGKEREKSRQERDRTKESDREKSLRMARRDKERESDMESIRGRDRDRIPSDRELGRHREREHERLKERVKDREQVASRPVTKATAKRKASESSGEESSDWGYEGRQRIRKSTSKAKRDWEGVSAKATALSLKGVKRESPPPKQRIRREPSPLPPSTTKLPIDRRVASGSSSMPKAVRKEAKVEGLPRPTVSKPSRNRRPSVDFTSSTEEEEEQVKPKTSKSTTKVMSSLHSLPSKNGAASTSTVPEIRSRQSKTAPSQSKREQLRSRYSIIYNEYIVVFQKLVAQKNKFATIVRYGSESPSGESDGDVDLMPLDEVEELTERHRRLHDELEEIKRGYVV